MLVLFILHVFTMCFFVFFFIYNQRALFPMEYEKSSVLYIFQNEGKFSQGGA